MSLRLHILQHASFEDEGYVRLWARLRGHSVSRTRLYAGEAFPRHGQFDLLIALGGPMNVYEYALHPWLLREKTFLLDVIESAVPVLGICLGAQLIADVLGGKVRSNGCREIGWHPVSFTTDARRSRLFRNFPRRLMAFHWHGDTFSLFRPGRGTWRAARRVQTKPLRLAPALSGCSSISSTRVAISRR